MNATYRFHPEAIRLYTIPLRSPRSPKTLAQHLVPHEVVIPFCMSLAQLKDQATHLDAREQRELIAFLISRQTERDEEFKQALTRKIDDSDPAHWVDLDEVQRRYSE